MWYTPIIEEWYYQVEVLKLEVGDQNLDLDCREVNVKRLCFLSLNSLKPNSNIHEKLFYTKLVGIHRFFCLNANKLRFTPSLLPVEEFDLVFFPLVHHVQRHQKPRLSLTALSRQISASTRVLHFHQCQLEKIETRFYCRVIKPGSEFQLYPFPSKTKPDVCGFLNQLKMGLSLMQKSDIFISDELISERLKQRDETDQQHCEGM